MMAFWDAPNFFCDADSSFCDGNCYASSFFCTDFQNKIQNEIRFFFFIVEWEYFRQSHHTGERQTCGQTRCVIFFYVQGAKLASWNSPPAIAVYQLLLLFSHCYLACYIANIALRFRVCWVLLTMGISCLYSMSLLTGQGRAPHCRPLPNWW